MLRRGLMAAAALAAAIALYAYDRTESAAAAPATLAAQEASPPLASEVARIQAHLARVEQALLASDIGHLTPRQRLARARHIQVLREYRDAGVFPHNHDFAGERVPYFVDAHGTHCAMAYLIARSGGEALVERVRATANNARIHDLAGDPELLAWLESAGLSADEAAMIQPAYDGGGCCWVPGEEPDPVTADYAVASVLTGAAGGLSIGMNLLPVVGADRPTWPSVIGVAAGVAGIGLGVDRLGDGGASGRLGAVNAGLGAVSLAVGAWRLLDPGPRPAPEAGPTRSMSSPVLTASPMIGAGDGSGPGLLLRLTF